MSDIDVTAGVADRSRDLRLLGQIIPPVGTPAGLVLTSTLVGGLTGSSFQAASGGSGPAPPSGGGVGVPAGVPLAIGSTNCFGLLLFVPVNYTTTSVGWQCQVSSGNLQFALYNSGGSRIAVKTSFASPGTNQRSVAWGASAALTIGWYYVFVQVDNSTIQLGGFNNAAAGLAFTFANTYASGMPLTLPAIAASQTSISLAVLA